LRKPKEYILIFIKGLCIGATEVLSGVSGSSMALILGAYKELLFSIKSINREALFLLKQKKLGTFWETINGNFLVAITSGIFIGLLTLAKFTAYLQSHHFILLTSFLFGLILIAALLGLRKIEKWNAWVVLTLLCSGIASYCLTLLTPVNTPHNYFFVIVAGLLAGCFFIIPGISTVFILLLIGKYQFIVNSFNELNLGVISVFLIACIVSFWLGARFMFRIIVDYQSTTVALLAGFMLGSLNKIWPWRNIFEFVTNSKGVQIPASDKSVWPWEYMAITGKDPLIFQAILMMALGVFIVVLIEKITEGLKTKI
jgi:putative membrane protein